MTEKHAVEAHRWCDALAAGDLKAVEPALDDASVLHLPGRSGLAGRYQGGEAIIGVLSRMAALTNGALRTSLLRVLAADEHAIVLVGRGDGMHEGRWLQADAFYILTYRGCTVRDIWVFYENQAQVDSFWAAQQAALGAAGGSGAPAR
jgi:ketosteroid isomerase-like protein